MKLDNSFSFWTGSVIEPPSVEGYENPSVLRAWMRL